MSRHLAGVTVAVALFVFIGPFALSAEEALEGEGKTAPAEKADEKKPAEKSSDAKEKEKPGDEDKKMSAGPTGPVTVKRRPFKVEALLEGAAEAAQATKISFAPREWKDFTLVKVVPHGQRVKAGDTLISFDTQKLDLEIAELEASRDLARRTVEQAEQEVKLFAETGPLDMQMAQRAQKESQEDLDYFLKVGRAAADKASLLSERNAAFYLESNQEELKQLEKMYKADDLTDETEEIILRRAKFDVDYAKQSYELAQVERKQLLDFQLPRAEKSLNQSALVRELSRKRLELTLPGEVEQKKLNLAKAQFELKEGADKLARLQEDRQLMVLKAPAAGVVYHGPSERGKWNVTAADSALHPGAQAEPHETLLTLVSPGEMQVSAVVPGHWWSWLKKDAPGVVIPDGREEVRLGAKLSEVGGAPLQDGTFTARVSLDDPLTPLLTPGLPCLVKFRLYTKADAISIPLAALFDDELDDTKYFVYLTFDDGTNERRTVTIGRMSDERVEILSGLEEGDRVLTEKPEDE